MKIVSLGLFLLVFAWAVVATWKWREAVETPVSRASSPLFANEAVADLERAGFLRQFAEQYFNYDETSYWRNQTALAFLMTPDLRDKKLAELADQKERKRAAGFRQSAQLVEVLRNADGSNQLRGALQGREDERVWKLAYSARLILKEVTRTLENPWGLEIESLEIQTTPILPTENFVSVSLDQDRPATLVFPCFVENVETGGDVPMKIKITSLRTSEIQLVRTGPMDAPKTIYAQCHERKFPLTISASTGPTNLFLNVSESQGQLPQKPLVLRAKAKKEAYQKTLEDELGFVVDDK